MNKGERIKELREHIGLSQVQLADKIGVSKQTLYKYENNVITNIPSDKIEAIAELCNTTPAYIMGWNSEQITNIPTEHGVKIPVLGHVAAGIPISAIEDILDWEEISQETANTGQYFGLQIKGDSMEPRILDGDVVIVRSQPTAETGDIVIAQVNGDEATCKKLLMQSDGLSLLSFNTKYDPMVFTAAEVESKPVRIIGKVVELRAKF